MSLTGWRFLVFALACAGAIALLASIGTPGRDEEAIDRHTGERVHVVRNVAEAIAEARNTGNVRAALERIRQRREEFPKDRILARTEAIFVAELEGAAPPAHPEVAVVAAEHERAAQLRDELGRRVTERLTREAALALLTDVEADSAIGSATEEFFAPLARWRPEHQEGPHRADEMAVRTLAGIEDPETTVEPELFLRLVRAFQSEDRPRARMRWLLRAYAAFPHSADVRDLLLALYLEQGRVREAFLLSGTALRDTPDDHELWTLRARMAGWLSLFEAEIEAREALLKAGDTVEARERLITLYEFVGRPEEAVPHAVVLARDSEDKTVLERPARLALDGGSVDEALDYLDQLARASDDPAHWRERIIEYASQDMRDDRVIRELDILRKRYPDRDYGRRLEEIYRRRDRVEELVLLLDERLQRTPGDFELEAEVLSLHATLGHDVRVKEILTQRVQTAEPRAFFASIVTYRAMEIDGLATRARELAASDRLEAKDATFVLDRLRPLKHDPVFRAVAAIVARRFADQPYARAFLLELVDSEPTDSAQAAAAERLALDHPGDRGFLKAWAERASWAGDVDSEIRARERWDKGAPADDKNLRRLADLYSAANRRDDAVTVWRKLTAIDGLDSESTLRLIDALFAADEYDEALDWLEKRAALPGAAPEDQLDVAEQLFGTGRFDGALRFYMAILDHDEDHAVSLLRAGQIRSWANDPRGAIPFFERRLQATDEQRGEVLFFLGEAHWAIHESEKGRGYHADALSALQSIAGPSLQQRIMIAKILARFGRIDEAQPIFERALAELPDDVDLVLDYADSMLAIRNQPKSRELADRAKALQPKRARTMVVEGKVLMLEKRYEEAAQVFKQTMELHGPDAGTQSELGRAYELAGEWRPAADAYRRSLTLQPENRDVSRALQRLADEVAELVAGSFAYRKAGTDETFELWAQGSMPWRNDRLRLSAALGLGHYSGRADAVNNSTTDVTETVSHVHIGGAYRFKRIDTIAGGVTLFPGAPGDAPVGGWVGLLLSGDEPYWSLQVDAFGHLLMENPAASVGLGGRRSGLELSFNRDLGERFYTTLNAGYQSLSLDNPSARDGLFIGQATIGWRVLRGENHVADPMNLRAAALPGLVGTHLEGKPRKNPGPQASLYVNYEAFRLLDDQELAALIPIGTDFDYLRLGGRADFHIARGLGAMVEGYGGYEFNDKNFVFGGQGGLTWRASHKLEFTCVAGYGTAIGRADDVDSFLVRLGLTYRW